MKKVPAKKSTKKNEITIEDLAVMMSKGFRDVNTKIDEDINNLATMVAREFESVDKKFDEVNNKFDEVNKKFDGVNKEIGEIKDSIQSVRGDILNLGDRSVQRYEINDILTRLNKLERRTKI